LFARLLFIVAPRMICQHVGRAVKTRREHAVRGMNEKGRMDNWADVVLAAGRR